MVLPRGLFEMGEYAFLAVYRSSYGMSVSDLWTRGNGMLEAWLILGVEWVIFMALAWYLEQVSTHISAAHNISMVLPQ